MFDDTEGMIPQRGSEILSGRPGRNRNSGPKP